MLGIELIELIVGAHLIVVADASCFPTASGVNPMISIEAIAFMNARRLAARLRVG